MANKVQHEKDLKALEAEFKAWRRKRRRGTRIPEQLWARAVSMAGIHGLWKISKRFRLDYYALKRRSEASLRVADAGVVVAATEDLGASATPVAEFVELPWDGDPGPECLLDLEQHGGPRLRIGLRRAGVRQLEAAARLLWELGR